ncbi:MAG: hypothetical protein ACREPY_17930, partial [Rhodanobacteraceae bacterium]
MPTRGIESSERQRTAHHGEDGGADWARFIASAQTARSGGGRGAVIAFAQSAGALRVKLLLVEDSERLRATLAR